MGFQPRALKARPEKDSKESRLVPQQLQLREIRERTIVLDLEFLLVN